MFGLAKAATTQALRLDPDSAEALVAQGRIRQLYDRDWAGAEASLKRAIELNPSLMEGHLALAHLLIGLGRFDEGLAQAGEARALDPLSPMVNAIFAGFLTAARQPEAAQKQVQRALDLQPDFFVALQVRGGMALDRGNVKDAIADFNRAVDSSRRTSQILAVQGMAFARAGERAEAQAILDELEARRATRYVPATSFAAVLAALGETDAALDELERADRERDIRMVFLKIDARWNVLRSLPRFRALAQRMGLVSERGYSRL
jgi:serine/threonine-protein kinase